MARRLLIGMLMLLALVARGVAAAVVAWLAVAAARRLAVRCGAVDRPHRRGGGPAFRALPRVGGAGIFVAMALACFPQPSAPAPVLLGASVVFAAGFIDDLRALRASFKLGVLAAAAVTAWLAGVRLGLPSPLADFTFTVGLLVALPAALNFVDGLDGLAAGLAFIAALILLLLAVRADDAIAAATAVTLAGALAGFYGHNRHPASVFMGDGGALFVGFVLALLAVRLAHHPGAPAAELGAVAVPGLDLVLAVRRRVARGDLFASDAQHVHHRLAHSVGHASAVRGLHAAGVVFALCGLAGAGALLVAAVAAAAALQRARSFASWSHAMAVVATAAVVGGGGRLLTNFSSRASEPAHPHGSPAAEQQLP